MREQHATPTTATEERTGAQILADHAARWGLQTVFHVPGEGILEILDAFAERQPSVRLIHARNESGMTFMASGAARATGRPALALAARAPGALNTCLALHTAMTDAVPLIMIIGQASMAFFERESFLDTDFHRTFGPLAKWVALVTDPARVPEYLSRAYHVAMSGRMGPVVLVMPEDAMQARVQIPDVAEPPAPIRAAPSRSDLDTIRDIIARAERPLLLLGGSGWDQASCDAIKKFATANALPTIVSYRRRDLFDNDDPHFAGEIGIGLAPDVAGLVHEADAIVALGVRLGELNMIGGGFHGFGLLTTPKPRQRLIHIHPSADELNRVYQADLAVAATPREAAFALAGLPSVSPPARGAWLSKARTQWEVFSNSGLCPGPLDLKAIYLWLRQRLPEDTIVAVGAGAYALWPQRYFGYHLPGTQLGPKSGAMGYGLPAAIGAAIAKPDRRCVAIAGDGCFMMNAEELATAVHHRIPVVTIVPNNNAFGAIRLGQQRLFGRSVGTELTNPDFVDFARSFGAHGERVTTTDEFAPAFERAFAAGSPALVELVVPADATRPGA